MTLIAPFKQKITTVGIITKRHNKEHLPYVKQAVQLLKKFHKKILFDTNTAPVFSGSAGYKKTELLLKCDLVVVLGGDGTLLKTARRIGKRTTLIMGINFGNLGVLTESKPQNLIKDLTQILHNDYMIDKRSILRVTLYRKGKKFKCLNCGYKADADYNGSVNVRGRRSIPEINIYTPYRKVKEILATVFSRHHASDREAISFGISPKYQMVELLL